MKQAYQKIYYLQVLAEVKETTNFCMGKRFPSIATIIPNNFQDLPNDSLQSFVSVSIFQNQHPIHCTEFCLYK